MYISEEEVKNIYVSLEPFIKSPDIIVKDPDAYKSTVRKILGKQTCNNLLLRKNLSLKSYNKVLAIVCISVELTETYNKSFDFLEKYANCLWSGMVHQFEANTYGKKSYEIIHMNDSKVSYEELRRFLLLNIKHLLYQLGYRKKDIPDEYKNILVVPYTKK